MSLKNFSVALTAPILMLWIKSIDLSFPKVNSVLPPPISTTKILSLNIREFPKKFRVASVFPEIHSIFIPSLETSCRNISLFSASLTAEVAKALIFSIP